MNILRRLTGAALSGGFAFSAAAPAGAAAQDAETDRARPDTIIVTATKREERLQDVPLSIDAFDAQTIQDSDLQDPQDLVLLTPGLQFAETIGRQTGSPAIRGVGPIGFADPTVLVYIDGFTLGFTRNQNNAALFDLERIEVLKGPQATLYGRNALGGVINYITKKPGDEFEGYIKGEVGSYETYNVSGSFGGPIIPGTLFAKAAIGYSEFGGFLDNEFDGAENVNDERDLNALGNIIWTPTEAFRASFTFNFSEADDACGDCAFTPPAFLGDALQNPETFLALGRGEIDFNDFTRTVNQDVLGGYDREEKTYVLNLEYDLGWATATNILGYADTFSSVVVDINRQPTPVPFFAAFFDVEIENDGWSNEFRLASNEGSAFNWIGGVYAFQNTRNGNIIFDGGAFILQDDRTKIENYAAFLNIDYDLTSSFNIGFGLRYDYESSEQINNLNGELRETDAGVWLPKFTATYKPSDAATFYATISRGYHAGGTNSPLAPEPVYDPEFLWNYEIGVKGTAADQRLGYELALYYMDWKDQQLQATLDAGANIGFIDNAGQSEIYGVEASVFAEPIDGLTLNAGVTWQHTEFLEYVDPFNAPLLGLNPDLAGNRLINTPEIAASGSAQYIHPLGGTGLDMRLRADMRYTGDQAIDVTNIGIIDPYTIVNLYAGVQSDVFELGVFADNVFDEEYLVGGSVSSSAPFPPLLNIGDPRIYGLRARVNF